MKRSILFITSAVITYFLLPLSPSNATGSKDGSIHYYYGDVKFFSPDDKTLSGQTVSLIKRIMVPSESKIIEVVLQPPREKDKSPKEILTTLKRRNGTDIFDASDEDYSFTGTLTFTGDEWDWNTWTYDLTLTGGSRLEGAGNLDTSGIHTIKTFRNPQGRPIVLMTEDLHVIDEQAYLKYRKEILGLYVNTFGDHTHPALIFIHGGPGFNSRDFEVTTAKPLASLGYFVVVYDEAGQGRSDKVSHYTYKSYADDLNRLIYALNLKKPTLIGHSHGGPIAIKFDEYYPNVAKAIILVSAPINFWNSMESLYENCSAHYKQTGKSKELDHLMLNFQKISAAKNGSQELIDPVGSVFRHGLFGCKLYSTKKPTSDEKLLRAESTKFTIPSDLNSMPGFLINESYIYLNHTAQVENNKGRYFAIYGGEDGLFTPTVLKSIETAVNDNNTNRFFQIPDASHSVYLDQQPVFLKLVTSIVNLQSKKHP